MTKSRVYDDKFKTVPVSDMTIEEAIELVDGCIENHYLNLHSGDYEDEAEEFDTARSMVDITPRAVVDTSK
jgi:hypothetical protein